MFNKVHERRGEERLSRDFHSNLRRSPPLIGAPIQPLTKHSQSGRTIDQQDLKKILLIAGLLSQGACAPKIVDNDKDGFDSEIDCNDDDPSLGDETFYGDLTPVWEEFCTQGCNQRKVVGKLELKNTLVTSFKALSCLTEVSGTVVITDNSELESFEGLNKLERIGSFVVFDNPKVTSFKGLESLSEIKGSFGVLSSLALESFLGLEQLSSVGGDFEIGGDPSLKNLEGLSSLRKIDGRLHLRGNDLQETMNGLDGPLDIGGSLEIWQLDVLSNIDVVKNITHIGGDVYIRENPLLCEDDAEDLIDDLDSEGLIDGPTISILHNNDDC